MPLPRYRIRTLMIAVAVVGITTGGGMLAWRSAQFRRIAVQHHQAAAYYLKREQFAKSIFDRKQRLRRLRGEMASSGSLLTVDGPQGGVVVVAHHPDPDELEVARTMLSEESARRSHHELLAAKYERAVRYPWLPVPPDPPPPN